MPSPRDPKKLRLDRWESLRRYQYPERARIIDPLLLEGESVMLWAPPGLGKSMLAMTIALAVAGGGSVCGWTFAKPRPVMFVDGEQAKQDIQQRLVMLEGTIEGFDADAAGRNLFIMARTNQAAEVEFPDLARPTGQHEVWERARRMHAALVICDNFATLADISDENEAAAMSPVLTFLQKMKQAGIATMLVHHSDKSASNYRGSSKLATTFEVILGLHKLDGRSELDGAAFEVRIGKFRARRTEVTRDVELRLVEAEGGPRWDVKPTTSGAMLSLLDKVRSCEFRTQNEVASALGWDKVKVSKLKAKAIGRGEITDKQWDACLEAAAEAADDGKADF